MTDVHQWSKVDCVFFVILCLFYDLLFAFDIVQLPHWNCQAFPFFIHRCLRIFIAWGMGMNLWTKLSCKTEFCPLPAMWSSWLLFETDSILGLADSCGSAIQLNLVFVWDASAFPFFNTAVSRMPAWAIVLLHGIAAAIGSNFRLTFLMMSLCSSTLGSIQ